MEDNQISLELAETQNLSFEENLEKLEEIVSKLENGNVPLDNAITEFNKAMLLVKLCDDKLNNAEKSIAKIINENGDIVDFDNEE